MKYITKYNESKEEPNYYYGIRWYSLGNKEFGEVEGRYNTVLDAIRYANGGVDNDKETWDAIHVDYKIVKIIETEISTEDAMIALKSKKYNI